ncbi:S8 family peptidase [Streptomyces sp. NPDC006463]|uniref:S8 family peptidase n=1 Tax=Streptomyces sp. NPDC006463 TaxID=3364746 RepID=UPI0036800F09
MRLLARAATAALLTIAPIGAGTASAAAPEPTPAPLLTSADAVPGNYIVTLDQGMDAARTAEKLKLKPSFVYRSVMNGFAAPLTPLQLDAVRRSLGVKSVEEDTKVAAPKMPAAARANRAPSVSWGRDRIDQRESALDNNFTAKGSGSGVNAYILDTGIDYKHTEFDGRASFGFDAMPDAAIQRGQDCQGHGTHVAGIVGGKTHGVATKANLISVRVLGCDGKGSYSGILAGLDWVAKNAKQPAVLNASLGGPKSEAINNAANAVSDAGILPVIAAGNESQDACNVSPASASRVLTIAATNRYDEETSFSNYGGCVSLYAPGEEIVSAKLGGGSMALSGTSMAAPHVAGVIALYKQAHPSEQPADIANFVTDESTKDAVLKISKGTPNQLLFTSGL